jgi:hypothetical protein
MDAGRTDLSKTSIEVIGRSGRTIVLVFRYAMFDEFARLIGLPIYEACALYERQSVKALRHMLFLTLRPTYQLQAISDVDAFIADLGGVERANAVLQGLFEHTRGIYASRVLRTNAGAKSSAVH